MLAKAVSSQMPTTFFNITASTIVSKWRGESEKLIKVLFDLARYYQPSTIFLDEIDSIMSQRSGKDEHEGSRRMKTELLIQLDGLSRKENERVFLLAASNLPWDLDQALLRRLEKRIFIGFPNKEERVKMLKKFLGQGNIHSEVNYETLADSLNGYSGSDILSVCKEARMRVVRRVIKNREDNEIDFHKKSSVNPNKQNLLIMNSFFSNNKNGNINKEDQEEINNLVTNSDLEETISNVKPSSVYSEDIYHKWTNSHGSI